MPTTRFWPAAAIACLNFFSAAGDVIDEQIFAQALRARVKRAAAIDARERVDELFSPRAVVEHEGIDRDAAARDALGLAQRLFRGALADPAEAERPFAAEPPLPAACGM